MVWRRSTLSLASILIATAGCGGQAASHRGGAPAASQAAAAPRQQEVEIVDTSRVKTYRDMGSLIQDSQWIVQVRAGNVAEIDHAAGLPFTVTNATLIRSLKGAGLPQNLLIRQTGQAGVVQTDTPLLLAGRVYVLFLQRFTFGPGQDTDQFVVVGDGAGLFASSGTDVARLDPESNQLPVHIDFGTLQAEIAQQS